MFKKHAEKKIRVLFVEEMNDLTSQIAEYYTRKLFGDKYEVYSAGPKHDYIDCEMISVMYQEGEDLRRQVAKDFKDTDYLPEDDVYDYVIFLREGVFKEWAPRTPWQGKQILQDLGSRDDFTATDDVELYEDYVKLINKVKDWVSSNMDDPEKLKSMVSA